LTDIAPVPPDMPALLKQEDRLAAAAAHLAIFAGFWVIAPVALYIVKRKESRFVAFHAAQAAMTQLIYGGSMMMGGIVFLVLGVIAGTTQNPVLAVVVSLVSIIGFGMATMVLAVVHAVAAYCAWQGQAWSIPIAGRLAGAILDADEGVAKV
jgi:uncharacterized membrane protein